MQLDIVMRLSRAWNRVDNDLSSPCRPHILLVVWVLALALALVPALVLALVLVLVLALQLVFLIRRSALQIEKPSLTGLY